MNGAVRIATVRGIPIRVHWSFLLVLPLLAYQFAVLFRRAAVSAGVPPEQVHGNPFLWGVGMALALFLSVLIHELAHSLYARARGGEVRDITLLMIGGVSSLAKAPERSSQEALMALAGPLTSFGLAALCFAGRLAAGSSGAFALSFALFNLASINLFLGLFNLLPAFPMDGGRVLRALLTKRLGRERATRLAARVGRVFATLFALMGVLTANLILLLIAFFVYLGAQGEAQATELQALLGGRRVVELMRPAPEALEAHLSVAEAAERMLRAQALGLPVVGAGQVLGVATAQGLARVPPARRTQVALRGLVQPCPPLGPGDALDAALRALAAGGLPLVPVSEGGALVGVVLLADLERYVALRELAAGQAPGGLTEVPT